MHEVTLHELSQTTITLGLNYFSRVQLICLVQILAISVSPYWEQKQNYEPLLILCL